MLLYCCKSLVPKKRSSNIAIPAQAWFRKTRRRVPLVSDGLPKPSGPDRTASASRPTRVAPRREPGHRRTWLPFPLSGAKLQMRARAGTLRPVRHRPAGQRGTILSRERMPDKMPLGASPSGQRLSRRAGGHFINISIYHVVTRPRPCGCPSAPQRANRLGRRMSWLPSQ
jgi:hypothetical protein